MPNGAKIHGRPIFVFCWPPQEDAVMILQAKAFLLPSLVPASLMTWPSQDLDDNFDVICARPSTGRECTRLRILTSLGHCHTPLRAITKSPVTYGTSPQFSYTAGWWLFVADTPDKTALLNVRS